MSMINYQALTADLAFDISAEALAGALLENNPELAGSGQIMIRPLGHINRASGREVIQVAGSVFNAEGKELVYIDINRESLFDSLPQMLFLGQDDNYEDEVAKAQHLNRQEEMARRFLRPFEQALYQTRIDLEQAERSAIKELAALLLSIYGLSNLNEDEKCQEQLLALALALPFLDRVIADLDLTGDLLATLLHRKVKITPGKMQQFAIPKARQTYIGEGLLGVNLVLGDSFTDGIRSLQVAIGGIPAQEIEDWLPGGNQRRLLEEHLFPNVLAAGEQVEISIGINDAECCFSLNTCGHEVLNILGYTTKIN
jgi:hypothetical protein